MGWFAPGPGAARYLAAVRIFFVTSWFPSRVYPTHGNFVARHARLVARDHELTVVAVQEDPALPRGRTELETTVADGYRTVRAYVGYPPADPALRKILYRARAYRRALRHATRLAGRPDLLHGQVLLDGGMAAAAWGRRHGIPHVITEHSTAYHRAGALPGVRGVLGRWAVRRAACVMPVSDHLGWGMRELNGLRGRYRTVSNVVDADRYRPRPLPAGGPFGWLHVSSFKEDHKNVGGILRAYAALPHDRHAFTLRLAGDGDVSGLRRRAAATGAPGITVSGPHTEAEVADLMGAAHAFVLFSRYENQPVVLLEAQLCGRPAIATPVGGIPAVVVAGQTGLLVPSEDEAALTAAMLELHATYADYPPERLRRRALGRYAAPAVRAALNAVYRAAVGEAAGDRPPE